MNTGEKTAWIDEENKIVSFHAGICGKKPQKPSHAVFDKKRFKHMIKAQYDSK